MRVLFVLAFAVLGAFLQTRFETADFWQRRRVGAKPSAPLGPLPAPRRSTPGTAL